VIDHIHRPTGATMQDNYGHASKVSAITFEIESYRTGAILAHEDLSATGRYPQLADDLFDWILRTERTLGIETYSDEKNRNDRASISLHTETHEGQINADGGRITLRTSEHLMFRIHEVCVLQSAGITRLLRTTFDEILAKQIVEKALASDDSQ
jgi:hypothetical protein